MTDTVRVMIVDDHVLIRDGLSRLFGRYEHIVVVAEAGSANEALARLETTPCDLVIMDLNLPEQDGIWCTQRIKAAWPDLPVLILSVYQDDQSVLAAIRAGASGYIIKSARREDIVAAIDTIRAGQSYLHPSVAAPVLNVVRRTSNTSVMALTDRERLLLQAVVAGRSNQEIAVSLSLSLGMVKKHLRSLYARFATSDRTDLAMKAVQMSLLKPPAAEP